MLKSVIHGDLRNQTGSKVCHRIRNMGHVPAVVYGHNTNTRAIELDKKEIDQIIRNYGTNVLFDLQVGTNHSTVMIKEIQRNPLTNEIRHIDLQQISGNKPVHTTVPIRLIGKEKVESSRGVVQQQLREVHIECLPEHIPESIAVDISSLAPGNPLKIADVEFGEEISILNEPYEVVAALAKTEKIVAEAEEDNLLEMVMGTPKDIK